MRRLVYSPKAYVYIKDQNNKIHDLTNYVTAGSVTRKISQVSSATVTLRNPDMIFTAGRKGGGEVSGPTFHPMDPITIYLKRAPGRPVRVFTGFLDTTPYLQLYPGVITLAASCTLKRLQYTYFDPGLPYMLSFLANYGWIQRTDGTVVSLTGFKDNDKKDPDDDKTDAEAETDKKRKKDKLGDGSVAELLFATLKEIGHWDPKHIWIEKIPGDIVARMAELGREFEKDNDELREELQTLLKNMVGDGAYGEGDVAGDGGATGNVKGAAKVVPIMERISNKLNIPPAMTIAVGLIETGLQGPAAGASPSGAHHGWFQMQIANAPYAYGRFSKRAPTKEETYDLGIATHAFCEAAAGWRKANPALKNDLSLWAQKVQGVNCGNNPLFCGGSWSKFYSQAKALLSKHGGKGAKDDDDDADIEDIRARRGGGGKDKEKGDVLGGPTNGPKKKGGFIQGSVTSGLKPYVKAFAEKTFGKGYNVTSAKRAGGGGSQHDIGEALDYGDSANSMESLWAVLYPLRGQFNQLLGPSKLPNGGLYNGKAKFSDPELQGDHEDHIHVGFDGPVSGIGGPNNGGGDEGGGESAGEQGVNPNAAAFAAQLNLGSAFSSAESQALQGEKSLMNDQPLLPFIQQLCESSLREFQSMPNGSFFAFYPDFFGETHHRAPYWYIDDIEILDGKVELTDESLVTHMYVVGDISFQGIDMFNRVLSSGSINVFNVFLADSVLNRPSKKNDKGQAAVTEDSAGMNMTVSKDEAIQFLERYGARPHVEEVPMIHHPQFEMFLAYQKFLLAWSRQFLTPFTFTFMPELFPGGKVGFPDHALQMYIEEVVHEWDYESGFMTQANLSAPAVFKTGSNNEAIQYLPENMASALVDPCRTPPKAKKPKAKKK